MSDDKPKSSVAWAGVHRGGGDLSPEKIKQMTELLNDFGVILENEAKKERDK